MLKDILDSGKEVYITPIKSSNCSYTGRLIAYKWRNLYCIRTENSSLELIRTDFNELASIIESYEVINK